MDVVYVVFNDCKEAVAASTQVEVVKEILANDADLEDATITQYADGDPVRTWNANEFGK